MPLPSGICCPCVRSCNTSLADTKNTLFLAVCSSATYTAMESHYTDREIHDTHTLSWWERKAMSHSKCCSFTCRETIRIHVATSHGYMLVHAHQLLYITSTWTLVLQAWFIRYKTRLPTSSIISGSWAEQSQRLLRIKMLGFDRRSLTRWKNCFSWEVNKNDGLKQSLI